MSSTVDAAPSAGASVRRAPAAARSLAVAVSTFALALIAILFLSNRLASAARHGLLALDFRQTFLPAAQTLVHGHSPYPAYGYPPLVAFLSVPFTVLPSPEVLVTTVMLACVPIALLLLDVRDPRCYAAAFLWVAVFNAVQTANVTLPMLVAICACWRWRDVKPTASAVAAGLAVATKLIAWPLTLWFACTGRSRAAVQSAVVAVGITLGLWATIGFSGLLTYPSSLHQLQATEETNGYTVKALAEDIGLPNTVATLLAIAVALAALGAMVLYARRGLTAQSFACAVVTMIVASPIVWLHSYALLLAVLGVLRPRFSALWLLPAALWFVSPGTGNGAPWQTLVTVVVFAVIAVLPLRKALPGPTRSSVDRGITVSAS
jgi:Glycosyltransferase family 87